MVFILDFVKAVSNNGENTIHIFCFCIISSHTGFKGFWSLQKYLTEIIVMWHNLHILLTMMLLPNSYHFNYLCRRGRLMIVSLQPNSLTKQFRNKGKFLNKSKFKPIPLPLPVGSMYWGRLKSMEFKSRTTSGCLKIGFGVSDLIHNAWHSEKLDHFILS